MSGPGALGTRLASIADPLALLEGLFEHSPVPYILFSADGHPVLTNPAYRAMFDAEPPPEYNVLQDEIAARHGWLEAIHSAFQGQTIHTPVIWYDPKELQHIQAPGHVKAAAISCTFFPLYSSPGTVSHVAVAYKDVTAELTTREQAQRQLAEAEERYRTFIRQSSDGIWRVELREPIATQLPCQEQMERIYRDSYVAECNDAMARMYGLERAEQLVGRRASELLALDQPENIQYLRDFIEGGYRLEDVESLGQDTRGERKVFQGMWVGDVQDGMLIRAWGIRRDVTEARRAEDRLRQSEEAFSRIFHSPLLGLLFTDYQGRVLKANDTFLRTIGYTREEFDSGHMDWNWKAMTPPEWTEITEKALRDIRATGSTEQFEKEYFRKDGRRVPVLLGSTRIESQQCNVTFVLDLTQRKAAEQRAETERKRLLDVLMQVPASINMTRGPEHVLELANPTFQRLVGDRRLLGLPIAQALPELSRHPLLEQIHRVYEDGAPAEEKEVSLLAADGATGERFLDMACLPLRDGTGAVDSVLSFGVDVTDSVRVRKELEEAVRARDIFLSVASHELKTPLTPLILKLEQLRREAEKYPGHPLSRAVTSSTEVGSRQVRKLNELVGDLLDVSRIRERRFHVELEWVDLTAVVREVCSRYQSESAHGGSHLAVQAEERVVGRWNRLRLEQVVTNLVDNALKYGADNPVQVRVRRRGARAILQVVDHGIGIGERAQRRIFERFERAVSERHYGGLGLGLYITREIVRALGGSIRVRSQLGVETVFTVKLPLEPRPGRRAAEEQSAPGR